MHLPESPRQSVASAYATAQQRVARTAAALGNQRARELLSRLERQVLRMTRYYDELRAEIEELAHRRADTPEEQAKFAARLEAIRREQRLRIAELRQKSSLRVQLKLINLLTVQQPKLLAIAQIAIRQGARGHLQSVWDPLVDAFEAMPCPRCSQPTFELALDRQGQVLCKACSAASVRSPHSRR
jgi:hypothetical protein